MLWFILQWLKYVIDKHETVFENKALRRKLDKITWQRTSYLSCMEHVAHVKCKFYPRTGHEGPEKELRYSSALSLTLIARWECGHYHDSAAVPPEKETQYPLYRRLGGPQGWYGWLQKILPPPEFDRQTVQPVANCYTYYIIPAHTCNKHAVNLKGTQNFVWKTVWGVNYSRPCHKQKKNSENNVIKVMWEGSADCI